MKIDKAVTFMWSCMLSFLLSFAGVACLSTAFHMAVDMKAMALCCSLAAGVSSICYVLPLGLVPLGGAAVIGGYLWQAGSFVPAVEALLNRISRQYNKAYDWGIIRWSVLTADDMEPKLTLALCVVGVLVAVITAWTVCRRKPVAFGLIPGFLPVAACLVVTDTVPQLLWLYLFMLAVGMLILTGTVRQQDEEQGNRLCTVAILPLALALLILFAVSPQEGYTGQDNARKMVDAVLNMEPIRSIVQQYTEPGTSGSSVDGRAVNLKTVGVRLSSQAEVLRVNAGYSGTLYLRGRALDAYDGVSWAQSGKDSSELNWPESMLKNAGEVVITTRYAHRMLYLPYYVKSMDMQHVNVGVENEKKLSQYSFSCWEMPGKSDFIALFPTEDRQLESQWTEEMLQQFICLSDSTRRWAEPLARKIVGNIQSPYHKAQAIGEYVRSSAVYDTNTSRMPTEETDFVRWFLENSETGYCVHFASAATVLLQAAGIPARYVTGYMVDVQDSRTAVVRADDAHAWVEYWLPGFGWTVLEATPAAPEEELSQTQATTEETIYTDTSTPVETEEVSAPSKPIATAPEEKQQNGNMTGGLLTVVGLALLIMAVEGQRRLRVFRKRKRRSQGTINEQVLIRWQETEQLAKLLAEAPSESLYGLALKAKFSQHTLSQAELEQFDRYIAQAQDKLKKRSVFHRLYYRLILVVY